MTKIAYFLATYKTFRSVAFLMVFISLIFAAIFIYSYENNLGYEDDYSNDLVQRAKKFIIFFMCLFLVSIDAVIFLPTIDVAKEMAIEKAMHLETNTKSEEEIREYFDRIVENKRGDKE